MAAHVKNHEVVLDVPRNRGSTMDAQKNRKIERNRSSTMVKKPGFGAFQSQQKKNEEKKRPEVKIKAKPRPINRMTFFDFLNDRYLDIVEKAKATDKANLAWLFAES